MKTIKTLDKLYFNTVILIVLSINIFGCKKFIDVGAPVTSINTSNVYASDATAAAVLTGLYATISNQNQDIGNGTLTSISVYPALSADELTLFNSSDQRFSLFYKNDLNSSMSSGLFWSTIYPIIFVANSAIEGLSNSQELTPDVKKQLLGESKFIRAFCYFYLTNLYGDVPLIINTKYKEQVSLPRTPILQVYQQIIQDLKDAQNLLNGNYLKADVQTVYQAGTEQRVRLTKWAAMAFLARVYLYTGDYINAEAQATAVISNSTLFSLVALPNVFKMNNTEIIWSLQPVGTSTRSNTGEGALFVLPSTGPSVTYPVYLSNNVINSFETNDQRKSNWTNSVAIGSNTYYYPFKYKIGAINSVTAEYIIALRLAELYLIRSEAKAQQNNINGAQADLNAIRLRAGLGPTSANNKPLMLNAIFHERQIELFTEWGHRWLDLKRNGSIDSVMTKVAIQKGTNWRSSKALYPIAQSEIILDANIAQNIDY